VDRSKVGMGEFENGGGVFFCGCSAADEIMNLEFEISNQSENFLPCGDLNVLRIHFQNT